MTSFRWTGLCVTSLKSQLQRRNAKEEEKKKKKKKKKKKIAVSATRGVMATLESLKPLLYVGQEREEDLRLKGVPGLGRDSMLPSKLSLSLKPIRSGGGAKVTGYLLHACTDSTIELTHLAAILVRWAGKPSTIFVGTMMEFRLGLGDSGRSQHGRQVTAAV